MGRKQLVARPVVWLVVLPTYHRSNVGQMHPGRPVTVVHPDSSSILLLSYASKQIYVCIHTAGKGRACCSPVRFANLAASACAGLMVCMVLE